jgi:hypothetical protein
MALNFQKIESFLPVKSPDGVKYLLENKHVGRLISDINTHNDFADFAKGSQLTNYMASANLMGGLSMTYAIGSFLTLKNGFPTEYDVNAAEDVSITQKNVRITKIKNYTYKALKLDTDLDSAIQEELVSKTLDNVALQMNELSEAAWAYLKLNATGLTMTTTLASSGKEILAEIVKNAQDKLKNVKLPAFNT